MGVVRCRRRTGGPGGGGHRVGVRGSVPPGPACWSAGVASVTRIEAYSAWLRGPWWRARLPRTRPGGLVHGKELHAVERDCDGAAVVRDFEVLPGAGDQVLAGQPFLADRRRVPAGRWPGSRSAAAAAAGISQPGARRRTTFPAVFSSSNRPVPGPVVRRSRPAHPIAGRRRASSLTCRTGGQGRGRNGEPATRKAPSRTSSGARPPGCLRIHSASQSRVSSPVLKPCCADHGPGQARGVVHPDGPAVVGVGARGQGRRTETKCCSPEATRPESHSSVPAASLSRSS